MQTKKIEVENKFCYINYYIISVAQVLNIWLDSNEYQNKYYFADRNTNTLPSFYQQESGKSAQRRMGLFKYERIMQHKKLLKKRILFCSGKILPVKQNISNTKSNFERKRE
jgi:hypothetical protein